MPSKRASLAEWHGCQVKPKQAMLPGLQAMILTDLRRRHSTNLRTGTTHSLPKERSLHHHGGGHCDQWSSIQSTCVHRNVIKCTPELQTSPLRLLCLLVMMLVGSALQVKARLARPGTTSPLPRLLVSCFCWLLHVARCKLPPVSLVSRLHTVLSAAQPLGWVRCRCVLQGGRRARFMAALTVQARP